MLTIKTKANQKGITLIELMIAMLIGLIITAGVIGIFVSNIKSSSDNIRMLRMNQELRGVMTLISDEIKRAGYSGFSGGSTSSGFMADFDWYSATNCLRYSYDEDGDGSLDTDERFGFRLGTGAAAGQIQWMSGGTSSTDCAGSGWESITDTNIVTITQFAIDEAPVPVGSININQIEVTIEGSISLSPNPATRRIVEIIRVRNEDAS